MWTCPGRQCRAASMLSNGQTCNDMVMKQPQLCAQEWKALIDLIQTDPYARDVTIFDPLNEPDAHGLGWDTVGPMYEQFAAYAFGVNPSAPPCSIAVGSEGQIAAQAPHSFRCYKHGARRQRWRCTLSTYARSVDQRISVSLRAGSLIAIEGMGQTAFGSNYGDGFATDARVQVSEDALSARNIRCAQSAAHSMTFDHSRHDVAGIQ